MSEEYTPHTSEILNLWLQRLRQNPKVDPLLLTQIRDLVQTGQAGSVRRVKEIVAAFKEKVHEPD
jgi:hypothetical protein